MRGASARLAGALTAAALFAGATVAAPLVSPLAAQSEFTGAVIGASYLTLGVASVVRLVRSSDRLDPGATVRIRAAIAGGAPETIRGSLTAADADSITVRVDSTSRRVARVDLRRMDVYRGRERKWAQGFGLGFLGGGAIGAVAGYAGGDTNNGGDFFNFTAKQNAVIAGILGAVTGSMVGALVGAAVTGDRWDHLSRVHARFGVSVEPSARGGTRVGAALRF